MNRRGALGALVGLAPLPICGTALAQYAQDVLLPRDFANRIKVNFQQLGREIEIRVVNPKSRWIVTQITTAFEYNPAPTQTARDSEDGGITDLYPNPEVRTWRMHILPNRADKLRMTLGNASVLDSLRLVEARGRERTLIEQLQRYLF